MDQTLRVAYRISLTISDPIIRGVNAYVNQIRSKSSQKFHSCSCALLAGDGDGVFVAVVRLQVSCKKYPHTLL